MNRRAVRAVTMAAVVSCVFTARPDAGVSTPVKKLPPGITRSSALENFDFVWERIRDTHFDPSYNGVDWYAVRTELRPRAAECRNIDSLRVLLWQMLGRLGQSHFGVIPSDRYESSSDDVARRVFAAIPDDIAHPGPGIDVRVIDGAIIVSDVWEQGAARAAGVERGWELVSVDGERCAGLIARCEQAIRGYQGADWSIGDSAHIVWALVQAALAGGDSTVVDLGFRDGDGAEIALAVARRPCQWPTVSVAGMPALPVAVDARVLDGERSRYRVGVVAVHFFWLPGVAAEVEDAIEGLGDVDAIVIDIRGNFGGVSAVMQGVASYFTAGTMTMGKTVGRDGEMPVVVHPRRIGVRGDRVRPFTGPLALLTDGLTASASELLAAGFKDTGRARLFGEATAGAALPATISELPNGDRLLHATFDFVRITGESLEGRPLQPHVLAPLTRAALVRGVDPALGAATAWIIDTLKKEDAR